MDGMSDGFWGGFGGVSRRCFRFADVHKLPSKEVGAGWSSRDETEMPEEVVPAACLASASGRFRNSTRDNAWRLVILRKASEDD